ncbi:ABC transporter permease [Nostoc sp. FACHB-152]|uniref:ABC transporter permease n=1 Tax=unclassified Nostoc TaxID=2593658 RepID=UPI00168A25AA|nr:MULTISPECIES: ABC transporter permease [unclassified Nostoc]MBD2446407.1 ABC transporter permease [Nostoc sp. FACHB-152]MBD2469638.1 ABC transporter permease [Nostoc sp. FACHB-145]
MKTTRHKTLTIGQSALSANNNKPKNYSSLPNQVSWKKRILQIAIQLTPLAVILLVWEIGTGAFNSPPFIEPSLVGKPSAIVQEIGQLLASGSIFQHIFVTFQEAMTGLALAMFGGISLGIVLAYSPSGAKITLPYVQIFNSLPRIALAPFFIVWFGIGLLSKVLLAALAAFFPIFFTTYQGLQSIERELVSAFQVMGANRWQMLYMVVLPSVLSWVIAGIRTSLGMALVGALVAEYIGSTQGLGYLLMAAQGTLNVDKAWAILVVLAFISVFLDWGVRVLEAYVLRWRPNPKQL